MYSVLYSALPGGNNSCANLAPTTIPAAFAPFFDVRNYISIKKLAECLAKFVKTVNLNNELIFDFNENVYQLPNIFKMDMEEAADYVFSHSMIPAQSLIFLRDNKGNTFLDLDSCIRVVQGTYLFRNLKKMSNGVPKPIAALLTLIMAHQTGSSAADIYGQRQRAITYSTTRLDEAIAVAFDQANEPLTITPTRISKNCGESILFYVKDVIHKRSVGQTIQDNTISRRIENIITYFHQSYSAKISVNITRKIVSIVLSDMTDAAERSAVAQIIDVIERDGQVLDLNINIIVPHLFNKDRFIQVNVPAKPIVGRVLSKVVNNVERGIPYLGSFNKIDAPPRTLKQNHLDMRPKLLERVDSGYTAETPQAGDGVVTEYPTYHDNGDNFTLPLMLNFWVLFFQSAANSIISYQQDATPQGTWDNHTAIGWCAAYETTKAPFNGALVEWRQYKFATEELYSTRAVKYEYKTYYPTGVPNRELLDKYDIKTPHGFGDSWGALNFPDFSNLKPYKNQELLVTNIRRLRQHLLREAWNGWVTPECFEMIRQFIAQKEISSPISFFNAVN